MKVSEVRSSLINLAEKLDSQWAYASQLARRKEAEGLTLYDDEGKPFPNAAQISYRGMTSAFESLGGEWHRKIDGCHRLCLYGVCVETNPDEEG